MPQAPFWLSANSNFHLTARHTPGRLNIAADSASRLHVRGHLQLLRLLRHIRPLGFICHHILSVFFLTDSRDGGTSSQYKSCFPQSDVERTGFRSLSESLDKEVQFFRDHIFFLVLYASGNHPCALVTGKYGQIHCPGDWPFHLSASI